MMRLGLFGGTFDPVHNGHLAVARAAVEAFELERLLLIPNRLPPHKQAQTRASFEHRLRMLEIACEGDKVLSVCDIENREGKSYTIQTLESLRKQYGGTAQFFFLIGADAFAEVFTWFRVEEVFAMTDFIVAARPGFEYVIPPGARVKRLDLLDYPESSSEIRRRLAGGQEPEGLPAGVARYIEQNSLYRSGRVTVA